MVTMPVPSYYQSSNIFDNLPALSLPKPSRVANELDAYLGVDIVPCMDPVAWWHENRRTYPNLSRMAISYLTIPGALPLLLQWHSRYAYLTDSNLR